MRRWSRQHRKAAPTYAQSVMNWSKRGREACDHFLESTRHCGERRVVVNVGGGKNLDKKFDQYLLFGGAFIPNLPTTHTHTGHTHTHTHKPKSLRPLIFCLVHSAPHIENLRTQGAPPPGPPPCRGLVAALGLLCWACVNFIFSPRKVAQPGVGRSRVQGTSGALRQSAEDLQRCDNGRPALSAQLLGQPHEIGLQIRP